VTGTNTARILTAVRLLTVAIVLCCALGGCARAAAPLTSGSAVVPPSPPSRPRLTVEKAIGVTTIRVIEDDSSQGSRPLTKCEIQILHQAPAGKAREVATLNLDGSPAQHEDVLSLLKRKACEAGANAVVIKSTSKKRVAGVKLDPLEAVALILGSPQPPVDPSPVPKTIMVTPEGPAAPKAIMVDPGASP
jgi:hypothetical protein